MMRDAQEFWWREFHELSLDLVDVLSGREFHAVGNAKDVCVYRERVLAKRLVQHHVCRLSAHAGQGFERSTIVWHFAPMQLNQLTRGSHGVLRLVAKQTNGFDVLQQFFFAQRDQVCRRCDRWKKSSRRDVHRLVGGLR